MTIVLSIWWLPITLTLATWVAAICWPLPPSRGSYDFGQPFAALVHTILAVGATLLIWLAFFAGMWAFGG